MNSKFSKWIFGDIPSDEKVSWKEFFWRSIESLIISIICTPGVFIIIKNFWGTFFNLQEIISFIISFFLFLYIFWRRYNKYIILRRRDIYGKIEMSNTYLGPLPFFLWTILYMFLFIVSGNNVYLWEGMVPPLFIYGFLFFSVLLIYFLIITIIYSLKKTQKSTQNQL